MADPGSSSDPTVATASPGRWRQWLLALGASGWGGLVQLGVTLLLGLAAGLLALFSFAALADAVMERDTQRLDDSALAWFRRFSSPVLDLAARVASAMGSEVVAVLLVLLLVVFVVQRRWGTAVALLLVTAGAQLLNDVLKALFARTRPAPVVGLIPAQSFSFPSGHAMVSAAFYLFLAYLCWRLVRGWWRTALSAGLLILILAIGLARLYLGVHYLTDVVAGYLAGFLWTDAVIIGGNLLGRRRRLRPSTPAPLAGRPGATSS